MRLTIARKIALAVIAIVITCVGTMAYVTSANLKPDQHLAITHYLVAISASLREKGMGSTGAESPK